MKGFWNTPSVFLCEALTWPAGQFRGKIQHARGSGELKAGTGQNQKLWQHIANWNLSPEISHCGKAKVPGTGCKGLARANPCAAGESSRGICAYRMRTRLWRWSDITGTLVKWWRGLKKHLVLSELSFFPFCLPFLWALCWLGSHSLVKQWHWQHRGHWFNCQKGIDWYRISWKSPLGKVTACVVVKGWNHTTCCAAWSGSRC